MPLSSAEFIFSSGLASLSLVTLSFLSAKSVIEDVDRSIDAPETAAGAGVCADAVGLAAAAGVGVRSVPNSNLEPAFRSVPIKPGLTFGILLTGTNVMTKFS